MYRLTSFKSHSVMIITIILGNFYFLKVSNIFSIFIVFGNINIISSESISNRAWSNLVQDLSLKIHDSESTYYAGRCRFVNRKSLSLNYSIGTA